MSERESLLSVECPYHQLHLCLSISQRLLLLVGWLGVCVYQLVYELVGGEDSAIFISVSGAVVCGGLGAAFWGTGSRI